MARTTNSDTLPHVESRYELGMLATQRVRDLNGGAEPVVPQDKDKLTVVALREIASGKLDVNAVRHEFVQSYKETPTALDGEETLEVGTTDPLLREIDAGGTMGVGKTAVSQQLKKDLPNSVFLDGLHQYTDVSN